MEELFPERKVKITKQDKQFITAELKKIDRKKEKNNGTYMENLPSIYISRHSLIANIRRLPVIF